MIIRYSAAERGGITEHIKVNFWGKRHRKQVGISVSVALLLLALGGLTPAFGQSLEARVEELNKLPCCDYTGVPGVVWAPSRSTS